MTHIKFCGMTRAEDLRIAAELEVKAVGFVLVPRSPRFVGAAGAGSLRWRLPASICAVALFQNADAPFVHEAIKALRPDCLQFHGDETEAFCSGFGLPYMKAVSMQVPGNVPDLARQYASASALLLDSHPSGGLGGTGQPFDWSAIGDVDKPVVLAGGLRPDNVIDAIRRVRPYAVDVSSGIEIAPGVKDSAKMRAFVKAVREADHDPGA